MKRLLYGLMIGLATFALGLGTVSVWNARSPISLCTLDADPEYYAGKTIRFRAGIDLTRTQLMAGAVCSNGETPLVGIRLDPDGEATFYRARADRFWAESKVIVVDAEVVGQLAIGQGCFGPKYHVTNARFVRVFSTHAFGDNEEAVRWFKSNSY
jgi:hypothetical protein